MRRSVSDPSFRWVVAGAGAVGVMVASLFLFRFPSAPAHLIPAAETMPPKAFVRMAKPEESNRLFQEEAELRDMRPLFLPTERNAALPEPRLEAGRTFLDNETLKLSLTDTEAQVSRVLPPIALLNGERMEEAKPIDALSPKENALSLESFGRRGTKLTPLAARSAFLQVTALEDGKIVLSQELPRNAAPPGDKAWAPIEIVATVDPAGLVGALVVTEGSRVEETDAHFKNFLAHNFLIGDRLAPGFYRITVSP